ncbi:MAG: fucose isomerase [Planctomycetaceae bacterium]|jgi:hypothetical protein|nr:fucose isomerase [Planctomycetaceae bacterium]
MTNPNDKTVYLVASGDSRLSANQDCWAEQEKMETVLTKAVEKLGYQIKRGHEYDPVEKHGFISSQKMGLDVFSKLDSKRPIIVAESVWQYSNHVFSGLYSYEGPILTVANWSGTWPGLVGMLNLNGCLTKSGKEFSTLWSVDFTDEWFMKHLDEWLKTGTTKHDLSHVQPFSATQISETNRQLGRKLAEQLRSEKAVMGICDEGCMGMYNAIIPDELLFPIGVFKERLSQSAFYYDTMQVSHSESIEVFDWLVKNGVKFHLGLDEKKDLTQQQVLTQCKMYIAAVRMADRFGCSMFGIQYQLGLKDLLPASDLVEGIMNNADRPPVRSLDGQRILFEGKPVLHFNEVDEGAALDGLLDHYVGVALGQPLETTLHDVRWGDWDHSGTVKDFVWVFQISGAAPPAHFKKGWQGSESFRQTPTFFPLGGGTLAGIGKSGEIVWSRTFVENGQLGIDLGRGHVVDLPDEEVERRRKLCTYEWPAVFAVLNGVSRDQFMARHRANHIQIAYADNADLADQRIAVKAAMAEALGFKVFLCGNASS